jgi:hypothetical protein
MENETVEVDELQAAYKAAVEEWIVAIRREEALASVNHTVAELDQWKQAHFDEDDARNKVLAAKRRYEECATSRVLRLLDGAAKQLLHRSTKPTRVIPAKAGIQPRGHDEAATRAGKPAQSGKPCSVVAAWMLAFASMTRLRRGRPFSTVHSLPGMAQPRAAAPSGQARRQSGFGLSSP